jgi:LysM repeat protein
MPTVAPVPASDVVVPTPAIHVVQEGETLESIAEQYGVDPFMLRLLNRMTEEEDIEIGQELIVPEQE